MPSREFKPNRRQRTQPAGGILLSAVNLVATFIEAFRWLYLPLGLVALLAVGIHVGGDGMDDRLRFIIERIDALLDGFWGQFELTTPWVDSVGAVERTHLARGAALVWEVAVDFIVAWPVMRHVDDRYFDGFSTPFKLLQTQLSTLNNVSAWSRAVRPVIALVFAAAGSYAIAGLVESALFKTLQSVSLLVGLSAMTSQFVGLVTMVWLMAIFGLAAVLVAFQQTPKSSGRSQRKSVISGTAVWPLAIAIPLALEAFLGTSIVSFFR